MGERTTKRIAVLGSTGSIGVSCLDVVQTHPERLRVVALVAHRRWEKLAEQTHRVRPRWAVIADASLRDLVDRGRFPADCELLFGPEAIERVAAADEVDVVVSAIVGAAGLKGTWAAVDAGKRVAIANKETLVIAGPLITRLAEQRNAELIPVDSEHSAVFQCLHAGRREEVERIVLTASGGPFRGWSPERLRDVTPAMALDHPTWNMGPKITIDSATLMNKALELIEARWLFDLPAERIEVVVHPQSVVHSMVEFRDGSVMAQLSPPDMRLPIQYALSFPERWDGTSPRLDWRSPLELRFEPPDEDTFPALRLGREAARRGGTCGAVLNAANEVAVRRFLDGELRFTDIVAGCEEVLRRHRFVAAPDLDTLLRADAWAREEMAKWNRC
ncbi:MAG: 1-deoxy-D-xylulose-5-phosphate reductoisomerase [Planctomycetota bacterium]|nr:MAG: 1-deoxy-D-xylulose-5-phosphate reductoisomerase [Planctomycetota bacterium]